MPGGSWRRRRGNGCSRRGEVGSGFTVYAVGSTRILNSSRGVHHGLSVSSDLRHLICIWKLYCTL